jgi:hypothetical protein
MANSKTKKFAVRSFVRRKVLADDKITDDQILQNWKALYGAATLTLKTIRRERTLFAKATQYDQEKGLIEFYSSQAELLLRQYQNIEQLLGPAGSDWTWPGEHCETLLREAIQRTLPPSLRVGKGYVYGVRKTENGTERSPEIDLLIYDADRFAPIFSMDNFVIVRAESVRAAVQVKRTLDANTLQKAVQNVVAAKQHVLATCQFNGGVSVEKIFSAVVSFDEGVQSDKQTELSKTYATVLQPHISEFHHGYVLPDFVGSLNGLFLHFAGVNTQRMLYQAFPSVLDDKNAALPFLLFMLAKKIRPFGYQILPAFPKKLPLKGHVDLWNKPPDPTPDSSGETSPVVGKDLHGENAQEPKDSSP